MEKLILSKIRNIDPNIEHALINHSIYVHVSRLYLRSDIIQNYDVDKHFNMLNVV